MFSSQVDVYSIWDTSIKQIYACLEKASQTVFISRACILYDYSDICEPILIILPFLTLYIPLDDWVMIQNFRRVCSNEHAILIQVSRSNKRVNKN